MSLNFIVRFGKKKPKENSMVYRYFCRTNNGVVHYKIKPKKCVIIGKLKLKKIGYYIYIVDQKNPGKSYHIKAFTKIPLSVLKSNLQKAIRLGNLEIALKTAYLLIILSPIDFFRRFSIIYIEDVSMDNHFNLLMWYMCANTKGYKLSYNDITWLLGLIRHVTINQLAWIPDNLYTEPIDKVRTNILTGEFDNYLLPMVYRYEFNGFKSELNLILNYIQKFKNRPSLYVKEIEHINPSKYTRLLKKDILKSTIDFHCSSIIEYLLNKYPNTDWTKDFLKKIIWDCRSSINFRKKKKNNHNSFYKCIKRDCDIYAELIIGNYFS